MMVATALVVFWGCASLLAYVWFGYPLCLWLFAGLASAAPSVSGLVADRRRPSVTVIIAVHNEESKLAGRLKDCLDARPDPHDDIQIVVASDGSTDRTVDIASAFANQCGDVRLVALEQRVGKTVAQGTAVELSTGEIVLFSDVDTRFGPRFLEVMTEAFSGPKVGCVTGAVVWRNPQKRMS